MIALALSLSGLLTVLAFVLRFGGASLVRTPRADALHDAADGVPGAARVARLLDGRAARMTDTVTKFGMEYDSIADTVSFGVAPAILAFHAGDFAALGWAGWVLALAIA